VHKNNFNILIEGNLVANR